ncbi:MAG: GH25 family lysozyme [bacterium]
MTRHMARLSVAQMLVFGLVAGCASKTEFQTVEQSLSVCASGPTLDGIDVSYWQPNINWDQVAASGISFAFIRVSDGVNTYDTDFQYNWSEAQRVGIIRGVYQFFRPNQDPIAQANLLINELGGVMTPGDLPPVIDVEASGGLTKSQVASRVQLWLDHVENALGVTPIIYTSPGLWSSYVNSSAFSSYPLWLAHYYVTCPTTPLGWSNWEFHQYTDSGTVPGITGSSVDRNVFNGTLADLQSLTYGGGAPPVCGDGVCNGGEDNASCPGDCPVCAPVPAAGRVLDQTDVCLDWEGDSQYWRTEPDGYGGSLVWTNAVSTQAFNSAVWNLTFDQAGWYRVEAYTDATWAESEHAKYRVRHGGVSDVAEVDQTVTDGWTEVGVFEFTAGGSQWVRLEDLTGESSSSNTAVVFDALRVTPASGPASCDSVPAAGRVIDQTDVCVDWGGDAQYWRTEQGGHGGSLVWTNTVASQAYNYAVWNLTLDQGGWYRVEAYTDATWAESEHAKYQVHHNGASDVAEVDQTVSDGWTEVGVFEFAAGGSQWIRLDDLTGEPGSTDTRLVFDALRLTPVSGPATCESVPPQGRTIDETDLCLEWGGDPQYWRTEQAGYGGSLVWTNTVASQVYNYVVWHLTFDQAGTYMLEAYLPASHAESEQAQYKVTHGGTSTVVSVDQTSEDGWTRIGDFEFAAGGNQQLLLEDLTGEPGSTNTRLVFDAIRFTRVQPGTGGAGTPDTGSGVDSPYSNGLTCSTGPSDNSAAIPLLLPLLFLWFRRRR